MANSSPTAGNLIKGGVRFLHNYGSQNTFLGGNAGNLTMTCISNTSTGWIALASNTTATATALAEPLLTRDGHCNFLRFLG